MPPRPGTKRPDAARNAKPKVKYIGHGAGSGLLRDPLDLRTSLGKAHRRHVDELSNHIGGSPTIPDAELIDQAARYKLLVQVCWGELWRRGLVVDGEINPAFEAFIKASRDQRAVLELLGLKKRAKDVPTLREILAQGKEATE